MPEGPFPRRVKYFDSERCGNVLIFRERQPVGCDVEDFAMKGRTRVPPLNSLRDSDVNFSS